MKRLLIVALLAQGCSVCSGADELTERKDGPVLLARGKDYTIHAFRGSVQGKPHDSRNVREGIVVFHTDTRTGQARWMIQTGVSEINTRRISYSISRLVGLVATDNHIVTVTYYSPRIFDRPPIMPPPDGGYRLSVFEKETGKVQSGVQLDVSAMRPKEVPDETTEPGVLQKTEKGFSALGTSFVVLPDGKIEKEKSPQPPAEDAPKSAPQK